MAKEIVCGPTPYADKFIEFQNAIAKMNKCNATFTKCICMGIGNKEQLRDDYMNAQVYLLKLYNDMLTLVQNANLLDVPVPQEQRDNA
jgi:hypothetical protein